MPTGRGTGCRGTSNSGKPNSRKIPARPPSREGYSLYSRDRSPSNTGSQHPDPKNGAVIRFEEGKEEGKKGFRGEHHQGPHHSSATRSGVRKRGSQWVALALLQKRDSFKEFIKFSRDFYLFFFFFSLGTLESAKMLQKHQKKCSEKGYQSHGAGGKARGTPTL